jgi:FlaG/FlaF family flagellin (archaellin)
VRPMKKFGDNACAISPVIGVIFMVALTVIMASVIAATVFSFKPAAKAPYAVIEIKEAKGGLRYDSPNVNFNENWIILYHNGGDSLEINKTKILIRGYGETQNITFSTLGTIARDDLIIDYLDLGYSGKLESRPTWNSEPYSFEYHGYEFHNSELNDGYWSTGERLTLNGQDSINGNESSTVRVRMNNVAKTSNNWRFSANKYIDITIIDIPSKQIIAEISTIVKHV